jgi:hypothetical protein
MCSFSKIKCPIQALKYWRNINYRRNWNNRTFYIQQFEWYKFSGSVKITTIILDLFKARKTTSMKWRTLSRKELFLRCTRMNRTPNYYLPMFILSHVHLSFSSRNKMIFIQSVKKYNINFPQKNMMFCILLFLSDRCLMDNYSYFSNTSVPEWGT